MKKFLDEKLLLETKIAQYLYHGELLQSVRLNPMNVLDAIVYDFDSVEIMGAN